MLSTVARIFVSSTWLDLQPERQAVEDAINRMSGVSSSAWNISAAARRPLRAHRSMGRSRRHLRRNHRRPLRLRDHRERVSPRARARPALLHLLQRRPRCNGEGRDQEAEKANQLAAFKRELSKNHIITTPFTTTTELAICLRDDLYRWFDRRRGGVGARRRRRHRHDARRSSLRAVAGRRGGRAWFTTAWRHSRARARPRAAERATVSRVAGSRRRIRGALQTLPELAPVEFYGQSGIGKTALLRHLAYNTPDGHFPDGIVYRDQVGSQPAADLPIPLRFVLRERARLQAARG